MVDWYLEVCVLSAVILVLGIGIKIGRVIEKSNCTCDNNSISVIIGER